MHILARLFGRRPKGYGRRVDVRYEEALVFESYLKTGDQLFTNERRRSLKPLVYHSFTFALSGVEREFKVKDDGAMHFEKDRRYRAYLNASLDRCWFDGHEAVVSIREPDDEEEADRS